MLSKILSTKKQFNSFNLIIFTLILTGCGSDSIPPEVNHKDSQNSAAKVLSPYQISVSNLEVDLPILSVDKEKLPMVLALDKIRQDVAIYNAYEEQFMEIFNKYDDVIERLSFSGSGAEIISQVMNGVDAINDFEGTGKLLAEKVIPEFDEKYSNDFSFYYQEALKAAKEEISGSGLWEPLQRLKLSSELDIGYVHNATSPKVTEMKFAMEESMELKVNFINSVIGSVKTNMLITKYQKGKNLADLINDTKSMLNQLIRLELDMRTKEKVEKLLDEVDDIKNKREEEILQARTEYRFPPRYTGGNKVSNPKHLEEQMKVYLEKEGYDVKKIHLASPWINVTNVLGQVVYYQIDYYVATTSEEENGLISVSYVTGKTSAADASSPFGTYSIGDIAEMYEDNL